MPPDFLRPSEVARRTGLSRSRVYQDIESGILKAHKKAGRCGRKGTLHITLENYRLYLETQFKPIER